MVINNLMIKLKQRDKESIDTAVSVLRELKGNVPVLLDSRVETDLREDAGYDIMLINTFNSFEDIQTYLSHPAHMKVADYISNRIEERASFCYKTEE